MKHRARATAVVLGLVLALGAGALPATAAPGLPAPTIMSAVATSATTLDVAWTSVDRAVSYEVQWTAYGEAQRLGTTGTTAQLKVFAATPYTVEVRSLSRNAASAWSVPVYVTTPPAAPTSVVATALRPDLVQLTWETGYGEKAYEVYGVAPNRVLLSSTAETTRSYVVVSVAYDDQRSAASEVVTVTTPPRWPSGVVISTDPVTEGQVTLSAYIQSSPEDLFLTLGGEVTFTVAGGEPQTVPFGGGDASLQVELTAGTYEVTAAWSGDSAYLPSSTTARIEVRPALVPFAPPELLASTSMFSAAVADVTGDGRPDVATVVSGETGNLLQLHAGLPDGSLAAPTTRMIPFFAEQLALGDLDGDGDADAAIAGPEGVLLAAGSPSGFGVPSVRRTTGSPIDVEIAEMTVDGLLDVVVSTTTALQVLPGTGRLSTGKARTIASGSVARLQVGNTTGDDRLEVAGVAYTPEGGEAVVVWTPAGTGWAEAFRETAASVDGVALGDVTGDGLADLAWTAWAESPESETQLRVGPAFRPLAVPYAPQVGGVAMGDFDGDGRDNLVAGPDSWSPAQVWRVTGDVVSPPAPLPIDIGGQPLLTGALLVTDLNGDSRDDLLVLDPYTGLIILRQA